MRYDIDALVGYDNYPSISPAKCRTTNPWSYFWKSGGHVRDESFKKPNLSWKVLLKRHQYPCSCLL